MRYYYLYFNNITETQVVPIKKLNLTQSIRRYITMSLFLDQKLLIKLILKLRKLFMDHLIILNVASHHLGFIF